MTPTEPKQTDNAAKFWNVVAKWFTKPDQTVDSPALHTVRQNADRFFQPIDKVLDFGCGSGDITLEIARKTGEVYGIDYSEGMIQVASQKANLQNQKNVTFLKTEQFPQYAQDHSFDVILVLNVLHYISEKETLYQRLYNLLKPQGLFISSTACLRERFSPTRLLMAGLTSLGVVPKMIFYQTAALENEIEKAGFTIVEAIDIAKLPERFIVAKKE